VSGVSRAAGLAVFRENPRLRVVVLAVLALVLLALSVQRSYTFGQYRAMYDNPIYRWRASVAVALSKMHHPPLDGYVAYRSISDYLNQHGLGLMEGEAKPLPTPAAREALIYDPVRLEQLFRAAAKVRVDPTLPPVPIVGNEKGEAEFYYFAFELFGISLSAMWKLYFVLLAVSALVFFVAFRRSTACLLLLSLYFVAHYALIGLSTAPWCQNVHNSRFFPVLSLLPSLHLLILLLRREKPTYSQIALAALQTLLLAFVIFCRYQAIWQPIALIAAALVILPLGALFERLRSPGRRWQALGLMLIATWPALLAGFGVVGLVVYQHAALNRLYGVETRTHTFWEPLYAGTVSASPELCAHYCFGQEPFSDSIGYMAVLSELRARHDTSSPIARIQDGQITINAMRNMGAYDRLVRKIFFDMARHHPWLVLKSFALDKLVAEREILENGHVLKRTKVLVPVLLGIGVGLVAIVVGVPSGFGERRRILRGVPVFVLLSLTTIEVTPDIIIPDTVAVFWILALVGVAAAPVALVSTIGFSRAVGAGSGAAVPFSDHRRG
jgi:hypothetical protein